MLKAEDAVPFVPAMTYCHVTRRFDNGLFRDIVFNGEAMTEKIIYHPEERIEFIRTSGIEMGTIVNEILEDDGALHLRFAFTLKREGLADLFRGSALQSFLGQLPRIFDLTEHVVYGIYHILQLQPVALGLVDLAQHQAGLRLHRDDRCSSR